MRVSQFNNNTLTPNFKCKIVYDDNFEKFAKKIIKNQNDFEDLLFVQESLKNVHKDTFIKCKEDEDAGEMIVEIINPTKEQNPVSSVGINKNDFVLRRDMNPALFGLLKLADPSTDEHKYILMVNTLSEILINMQNKSKVSDELIGVYHNPVVSKVIAYINENIKKNITLTDICNDLNFSRAHISNEFSRVMKIPVMTYIRYKKIIAAHQKILEGNVKINEVAYEYGFEEYSTFYRNYIKIIGKPPYSNSKKN